MRRYKERTREWERERAHTHTHTHTHIQIHTPWVVSIALCFFVVYVGLRCACDFPHIGYCFGLAQKGSAGVGGEASSHVAQSVVYVICWFHFCNGFPTSRILFCVGSKSVCRGSVWRSKSLLEPARRSRTLCRCSKSLPTVFLPRSYRVPTTVLLLSYRCPTTFPSCGYNFSTTFLQFSRHFPTTILPFPTTFLPVASGVCPSHCGRVCCASHGGTPNKSQRVYSQGRTPEHTSLLFGSVFFHE